MLAGRCIDTLKGRGGIPDRVQFDLIARDCVSVSASPGTSTHKIRANIERDFKEGRTINVDGWVLAESEVYHYIARSSAGDVSRQGGIDT